MNSKLKILCLHGYRQNAAKFSSQTGALRKILKNEAEFHFLSAPHKLEYYDAGDDGEDEERAWWFTTPTGFSSRDETDLDKGFAESVEAIRKCFRDSGPFHGILGFSQGAALVSLLCALKERKEFNEAFDFVIIVSGFKSRCTLHSKYYDRDINVNSLHVIGDTDQIIPSEMSYDLTKIFVNPAILQHTGGHYVPGRSVFKQQYVDFLQSQRQVQAGKT